MKPILLLLLVLGLAVPTFTGCTSSAYTVAPGADSLVVHSERAIESAFVVVDEFLKWEFANKASAGKEVRRVAEQLRRDFPEADKAARSAVKAYKANRTPSNQANLNTWLALLLDLKTSAVAHYGTKTVQAEQNWRNDGRAFSVPNEVVIGSLQFTNYVPNR